MKKSFLRILSITVTLLLIAGMVMIPAFAAVPETGTPVSSNSGAGSSSVQTIIHRASDAADATAGAWVSGDSSVWKFAVGTLGDTFKPSSADFAAPTAEAVKGNGIKLSWTAPAEGTATVKVVGDNYNKEVVTTASSITLGDTKIGKSYQVQVTVGDVSSQILAYNNIYSPITAKNPGNDTNYITIDRFNADGEVTNQWGWTVFNVKDYTDMIGENTGFIFRVESVIDPEQTFNITHYYDSNNQTGIREWKEYESADDYINSADSGIAFNTYLGAMETNAPDDGGTGSNAHKYFEPNADTTRNVYRIDTTGKGINTGVKNTTITALAGMKNNFVSGYVIVPFDVVGEAGLEIIKEYGVFSLTTEAFRYYPKNTFLTTNADVQVWQATEQVSYQYTDIDTEKAGNIAVMQDREIFLGDAGFISDIDAFIATCTDTSSAENANVDFTKLANVSDTKGTVYLNTATATTVVSDSTAAEGVILSSADVVSTYTASKYENVTYTTAAGEKMMLGFTAPAAGVYDVSCPITVADYADKGVYTRVIKETADGTKTIIQAEAAYNGERHLALITEQLEAGDTVWFEAWANSAATVIDLGMPQMTNLALYTDKNATKNYSWYTYYAGLQAADKNVLDADATMSYGYFINNFEVDGKEYDFIYAPNYDNATTVKHDMLGLASMAAVDDENTEIDETDATALYNALKRHEKGRNSCIKTIYDCYRYKNDGTIFGIEQNATDGWQSSGVGITGTRQLRVSYGFTTAFGGSLKNVYYDAGVYMQFTAPSDGVVTSLSPGNGTALIGKGVVLHNTKVIATSTGAYNELAVKDIAVKKGDTITVCYGTTDGTNTFGTNSDGKEIRYKDIYDPRLTFNPDDVKTATVSYDQAIDSITPDAYKVGDTIKLPAVAKAGAIFQGWNDGTATYAAGTDYTVNADTAFTAEYLYYGDLDGAEGVAQASDVTVMRKIILKVAETGASEVANLTGDIDANGVINLTDLVKIKKMSANIDVTVGAK